MILAYYEPKTVMQVEYEPATGFFVFLVWLWHAVADLSAG